MLYPSKDQLKEILKQGDYKRIPVREEMFMDLLTPVQVVRTLKQASKHCFLLESAEASTRWGRYSFIGYDPELLIRCQNGTMMIEKAGAQIKEEGQPQDVIRRIISENRAPRVEGMPTFTGGLVGYFSYDYMKYNEASLNLDAKDEEGFQDLDLMLFSNIIAFDNYLQKIYLIANIDVGELETAYETAEEELLQLKKLLHKEIKQHPKPLKLVSELTPLFSEEEYCRMVEKGKQYIKEGDIFQVVLSNRLEAKIEGSLFDVYRVLRTTNPSPYMFYFSGSELEIAGASPETLVKLEDGIVHTFPLAGTRRRGTTEAEDVALEKDLLSDEKELAEHNMLVDLGRNDVGKISCFGSVQVEKYMSVERFSHVMHLGSVVRGQVKEGRDALDAIDAILPAGTLSGAPKIRACQIINELENNKRGIYGGAIGYIDFTGNMDTCIAIRIAYAKNGKVFIRTGAGIVADSVPKKEYQECIQKAKAVVNALYLAEGGLTNDSTD